MNNTFELRKRVFAIVTAAAMILGTVSAALVPQAADAASGGDWIKGETLSAVYYYGHDGSRYTVPNEKTYMTWESDFDGVEMISDSALADISLAGNVVYRPGSYWIKITSDAKTYAVSTNGMIHWIESEDVATDYAGSDWNQFIQDVPDVFFVDYTAGSSLTTATAYDGLAYMDGGDYYLSWDGEMRMMTEDGRDANNYWDWMFLDGDAIDSSALTAGDDIDASMCALTDAAQTGDCEDEDVAMGGEVYFDIATSTPSGATLPKGANSVEVMTFDIEGGDEDAEVNSIVFKMDAIGATTNVNNVYLYEGSTRLTEARSLNASTRKVTFGSLDLEVEAGDTRTLTLRVELSSSASAGDDLSFEITDADAVDADGDVDGDFPVQGETFDIANSSVGEVDITKGTVNDDPSLGENDAEIGEFKLTANTEDAEIEAITLKIDNAGDHDDFWLWDDEDALAMGEYIGDKLVLFDLSDDALVVEEGNTTTLNVTADIGGDSADAIKVYVDNSVDVTAIGGDFGFGMIIDIDDSNGYDGSSCTSSSGKCSYSTIQGGEVTFTSDDRADEVAVDSQDQSLFTFTLTAAQEITVKDLDIIVYGDDDATPDNDPFDGGDDSTDDDTGLINTNGEGNLTDIKIVDVDTGDVLMGPLELDCVTTTCGADGTNDGAQTIDFTDDFMVEAGETLNLEVRADFDDTITSGTDFGATLDISGFVAEDGNGDNLTNATDVIPTSDLQGANREALSPSVTFSLSTVPGDVTAVQGLDGVEAGAFNVKVGKADDVNINSAVVTVYAHDAASGTFQKGDCTNSDECGSNAVDVNDFISSCSLKDSDDNVLAGPESPASNGQTITFGDINWDLAAGANDVMSIWCDLSNPSDSNSAYFAFDLDDVSADFSIEDSESNTITATADDPNGATSPTNVLTVATAGTLATTVDSSTPAADIVLTGSDDNHVSAVRLAATNEAFEVDVITFSEEQAEDDTGTSDSNAYANNVELVTIMYEAEDGSTEEATATLNGNEAEFNLTTPIYVEEGENTIVDVYVNVPATDRTSGGAATSNEKIRMGLFADTSNDDNFSANGVGSSTALDDDDITVLGDDSSDGINTFVVRETRPTVSLNSSSPGGSGFIPGDQEVFRFDVAASGNEDVIVDQFIWKLASTDNTGTPTQWNYCDTDDTSNGHIDGDTLDLYNYTEDASTTLGGTWTMLASDAATCDPTANTNAGEKVEYVQFNLTTSETIPAGETVTFSLWFDSSFASAANDDSVQFTLEDDPLLSEASFISSSALDEDDVAATDTTISVADGSGYSVGDIICMDTNDGGCASGEELMLVTAKSSNDLTVVRGYLGTEPDTSDANDTDDDVDRMPSTFVWEDDGVAGSSSADHLWGAYLVDELPITGNSMQF